MVIRFLRGAPKHPNVDPSVCALYVGTAASAKLEKSAVKRNRMRRRCREALRITVREIAELPTLQLLIAPRSSSLDCAFADILQDVRDFLSTV
jgi:ribonuclease P protein component